jgi:hypothetical protein
MLTLYHRTTVEVARTILRDGFRDSLWAYTEASGVWVSDRALGENEGGSGTAVLRVNLDASEADLVSYERIEEAKPYHEWLMPADLLNSRGTVEMV